MTTKSKREKRKIRYSSTKERLDKHDAGFMPKTFKLPKGVQFFKFRKAGLYKLDIIPFVAGENNPYAEPGDIHWERTYWGHKLGRDMHLCPRKSKNKNKCAGCDEEAKMGQDPDHDKELRKSMMPKERQLFYIRDHAELDKGIQIHEASHYNGLGEAIDAKLKLDKDDEMGYKNFFHLDGGFVLKVSVEEESSPMGKFFKPTAIEMLPRKKALEESLLDDLESLDDLLIELDYKEMKELISLGGESDEDEDDEEDKEDEDTPPKKKRKSKDEDDEDDDSDEEDSDDEEDEDDDDDVPTKKGSGKSGGSKKKPEPDDEDDEEDEDEDDSEVLEAEYEKGDKVSFEYRDETHVGVIIKVDELNELYHVKCKDRDKPYNIGFGDDSLEKAKAKKPKDEDEDDDEEEEEEDEAPPKKKKSSKKSKDEDDEEEEEDDEDDDIPFEDEEDDEDDEDEDEAPPPKKKKKK